MLIIICYKENRMIDYSDLRTIRGELYNANIRLMEKPARITIKIRPRGGIGLRYNGKQELDQDDVKAIMNELGFSNASVYFGQPMVTAEQLIDHIMGNRIYTPELVIINKSDLGQEDGDEALITEKIGHSHWIKVSALKELEIPALRHKIFLELHLIRVYLKPPQQEADMDDPIILSKDATIETLCKKLHKTFITYYRYALIWGKSAKHPGQKFINMDHKLLDGDIVSIYLKR